MCVVEAAGQTCGQIQTALVFENVGGTTGLFLVFIILLQTAAYT